MNSGEMNIAIYEIDKNGLSDQEIYNSCIGGKIIPYIGWFWRTVDFGADSVWLGILPVYKSEYGSNDKPKVGFMENNKWGYDEFEVKGFKWLYLKKLIITALEDQKENNFRAIDEYMQSLVKEEVE